MSIINNASLITTPNGYKAGKLYSFKPIDGSGDFNVVRNTTATRVNKDGIIETVGANVPRLDYSNGNCPAILVEPQRTNLLLRSEDFNNAYWNKAQINLTINSGISPNNTNTAILATLTGTGRIDRDVALLDNTVYSASIFIKNVSASNSLITMIATNKNNTSIRARYTLIGNGTVSDTLNATGSIIKYPNDWYRCVLHFNSESGASMPNLRIVSNSAAVGGWNTGQSILVWGAQIEVGSNASSYIPTQGSAVTRNADVMTVNPPVGVSEIIETDENNNQNIITTIPPTYQIPNGRWKSIIMK